jgi:biopolymer transport protein TolR
MARKRRKPMAEINVVPYIDVMMVLLVIFMISAPLLTQGVKIDLPQAETEVMNVKPAETVVVKVDIEGNYHLTIGTGKERSVSREDLLAQIKNKLLENKNISVLVAGDKEVRYAYVMDALALLSQAGIPNVGLMTRSLDETTQ